MYRPRGRSSTFQVEQSVLPKRCRDIVLKLAHDVPLASHLGKEKTGRRLLRRFYWPTLFKDVAQGAQHASDQGKIKPAPLVPLPRLFTELGSQQKCRCIFSCSKIVYCNRRRMICDGCEQFNLYTHARFEV